MVLSATKSGGRRGGGGKQRRIIIGEFIRYTCLEVGNVRFGRAEIRVRSSPATTTQCDRVAIEF